MHGPHTSAMGLGRHRAAQGEALNQVHGKQSPAESRAAWDRK